MFFYVDKGIERHYVRLRIKTVESGGEVMKKPFYDEIEKLVNECFKQIADHTLQSEIISPHIRMINENLKEMSTLLEMVKKDDDEPDSFYRHRERITIKSSDKEALIKIAYAMSRFDYQIINDITKNNYNQTEAFNFLSHILKTKPNTLKNYRDMFDPYVEQENSKRKGWYQKELSPDFRAIKDNWDNENYDFIKDEIKTIIQ